VLLPEPGGAGRIAAQPPFSITAAWITSQEWAWLETHQFIAHSNIGKA
jgi:hypothetical protein